MISCLAYEGITALSQMPIWNAGDPQQEAEFVTKGSHGSLESRIADVWLDDPHEAFILIPPKIGNAFKAARLCQKKESDICPFCGVVVSSMAVVKAL